LSLYPLIKTTQMFSIFKKKVNLVTDISWLGVDIHSHLLPGIDDGAENISQSITYIKGLQQLGFNKLICTPHIFTEMYPNTAQTISQALELVKEALHFEKVGIEIDAAAEYMIDDTFKIHVDHLCLPGNYILVEMSYLNESPGIEQVIFDLQIKGYNVILAHPERYIFYHHDYKRFHRYKDMGVLFQLNLLSVTGYYGKEVKKTADYLLGQQTYDFAGTDLHHEKHLTALKKAVESGYIYEKLGNYNFSNKELFL